HLDFLLTTGAESYLSIGKTAAEILRLSREQKATMIVMGHTGKDLVPGVLAGRRFPPGGGNP
ncbi:MAG: universal stress protein, partial [Desulfobacterales bacterium]